jgi:putative transcriptional regulator
MAGWLCAACEGGSVMPGVTGAAVLLNPEDTLAEYVGGGRLLSIWPLATDYQAPLCQRSGWCRMMGAMEEQSLSGRLLAATPQLGDPNFRRTVVLIVEDDLDEGTLGVILNRPTEVPLDQVLEPWTPLASGPPVVFRGGPISPNSALALALAHGSDEPVGWRSLDGTPMMSRIGLVDLGAPPELLADGITSMRVFAGYAGWGAGQLREEIDEGAWYVLPGDPADAFAADPERLWQQVLRRQGGDLALVATFPDDPEWN